MMKALHAAVPVEAAGVPRMAGGRTASSGSGRQEEPNTPPGLGSLK